MKKTRRGRTKGSKVNNILLLKKSVEEVKANNPWVKVEAFEPAPTRLDVLMSELETEVQRAIAKMKAVF